MNRFELLRYERGLTISEVAEGTGLAIGTLRRLEDPDAKPTAPVVKRLADYYKVPVADLLGLKDAA
jgi:transcriptional regulator with XRE-family HTH domain